MKKIYYMLTFFVCIAVNQLLNGCPTCVGRIKTDSPPFFSDSHQKQNNQSSETQKLSWREEILKQQEKKNGK